MVEFIDMPIYDLTLPLSPELAVWPGDAPVEIDRSAGLPAVSRLAFGSHSGTHVDPPAHFLEGGMTVDRLPLELLVGPAWLAQVDEGGTVTAAALEAAAIPPGIERLLLRTRNSDRPPAKHGFDPDFSALAPDAADWLNRRGVRLVGIDAPSIEPYDSPAHAVHNTLLGAGVIIVEGLLLAGVPAGAYTLICLPLRIEHGDGAPARVLLLDPANM